jgi:hypothetical protein
MSVALEPFKHMHPATTPTHAHHMAGYSLTPTAGQPALGLSPRESVVEETLSHFSSSQANAIAPALGSFPLSLRTAHSPSPVAVQAPRCGQNWLGALPHHPQPVQVLLKLNHQLTCLHEPPHYRFDPMKDVHHRPLPYVHLRPSR